MTNSKKKGNRYEWEIAHRLNATIDDCRFVRQDEGAADHREGIDLVQVEGPDIQLAIQCHVAKRPDVWRKLEKLKKDVQPGELPLLFVKRTQHAGNPGHEVVMIPTDEFMGRAKYWL